MNFKAIYYALSRMFLPTLSVILLALMWSLSPSKTFSFLLSDNTWASVIRIILMIAEMLWFWFLYDSFSSDEELNKEISEIKIGKVDAYNLRDTIINKSGSNQYYNMTYLKDQKVFVIKHSDKPSDY